MYLAYGVTSGLDNSMWSQNVFPTAELIDAGLMIGPRTYSTGDPLYGFGDAARQNSITSYEQALELRGDDPEVMMHIAIDSIHLGHFDIAVQWLERCNQRGTRRFHRRARLLLSGHRQR